MIRKRYLVNARRQLRSAVLVALVVLVPVIALNVVFHLARAMERESLFANAPPQLLQTVVEYDRTELVLMLVGSIVFVGGVFVMTILETHHTSGAAIGVARHLMWVRDGRYDTRLKLRPHDNLTELVEPFNEMTAALRDRSRQQATEMEAMAIQAEGLAGGDELASRLRLIAAEESRLSGEES